jgi:hypothetical protein
VTRQGRAEIRPVPAILAQVQCDDRPIVRTVDESLQAVIRPSDLPHTSQRVNPLEYLKGFVQQWGTENGKSEY